MLLYFIYFHSLVIKLGFKDNLSTQAMLGLPDIYGMFQRVSLETRNRQNNFADHFHPCQDLASLLSML